MRQQTAGLRHLLQGWMIRVRGQQAGGPRRLRVRVVDVLDAGGLVDGAQVAQALGHLQRHVRPLQVRQQAQPVRVVLRSGGALPVSADARPARTP